MAYYYEKDGITIHNTEALEILPTISGVDLVLTDPPYGINVTKMTLGNAKKKFYRGQNEWDNAVPTPDDFKKLMSLMRWCIKIGNGNVIFDPYMGSGSTLKAALEMGVNAIGCETEEYFCEKAAERLRQPSLIYDA